MYFVRVDLKAGYKHPRVDEASVNRRVWNTCPASRKGVISTLGCIHPRIVEAARVPAVPRVISGIN